MFTDYKYLGQWENCDNLKLVEISGDRYILTRWKDDMVLGQKVSSDGNLTGDVKHLKPVFQPDANGNYNVRQLEILE